jgi:hypothetical protein
MYRIIDLDYNEFYEYLTLDQALAIAKPRLDRGQLKVFMQRMG